MTELLVWLALTVYYESRSEPEKCQQYVADVKREIGMGGNAIWKIIKMGKAVYSKEVSALVATERRVLSRAKNKEKNT